MATLTELKRYLSYQFSSGPYTGQDYRTFQTKYLNYLRAMCKNNGWELVNAGRNHYCFSAFIKGGRGRYVYLNISDVRYFSNDWYKNILVRTAADERDYLGRRNNYTALPELPALVARLLNYGG